MLVFPASGKFPDNLSKLLPLSFSETATYEIQDVSPPSSLLTLEFPRRKGLGSQDGNLHEMPLYLMWEPSKPTSALPHHGVFFGNIVSWKMEQTMDVLSKAKPVREDPRGRLAHLRTISLSLGTELR